ncbi:MAG: transporter substrate-binding domain-containing protein [Gammaproteobacteria bacterium]|nr:transporter substrate-binding domain-containing protein [Gammaproteobacteria bacterium]
MAFTSSLALDLDDDERQWLSEHPTIRLAVDIDWSPFEYIDKDKNYVGMAAEYIALMSHKLGIQFEVEKSKPW